MRWLIRPIFLSRLFTSNNRKKIKKLIWFRLTQFISGHHKSLTRKFLRLVTIDRVLFTEGREIATFIYERWEVFASRFKLEESFNRSGRKLCGKIWAIQRQFELGESWRWVEKWQRLCSFEVASNRDIVCLRWRCQCCSLREIFKPDYPRDFLEGRISSRVKFSCRISLQSSSLLPRTWNSN